MGSEKPVGRASTGARMVLLEPIPATHNDDAAMPF